MGKVIREKVTQSVIAQTYPLSFHFRMMVISSADQVEVKLNFAMYQIPIGMDMVSQGSAPINDLEGDMFVWQVMRKNRQKHCDLSEGLENTESRQVILVLNSYTSTIGA